MQPQSRDLDDLPEIDLTTPSDTLSRATQAGRPTDPAGIGLGTTVATMVPDALKYAAIAGGGYAGYRGVRNILNRAPAPTAPVAPAMEPAGRRLQDFVQQRGQYRPSIGERVRQIAFDRIMQPMQQMASQATGIAQQAAPALRGLSGLGAMLYSPGLNVNEEQELARLRAMAAQSAGMPPGSRP